MDVMASTRDAKRRRIAPPVLDGDARGWATHNRDESDGEEDVESDAVPEWHDAAATAEYKDANSFLHDLHALHQHRLMFCPAPLPLHPPNPYSCPLTSNPIGKSVIPQVPQRQQRHKDRITNIPEPGGTVLDLEVVRVKERYEDTNKLLGSLFLSRRRELGADVE